MQILENLTSATGFVPKDVVEAGPEDIKFIENDYFSCLTSKNSGIVLTNLSEYMMTCLLDKSSENSPNSKEVAFWFRLGLKYFETN